ncbi:MAG: hypothetical protein A2736_01570 [Candidatus Yanofskybacteria bacterium RIFCSPHIGHO2_01_FULL_41_27]|uniref:ABC-3 protein n=3 Tax=Parcubacteria group TaxID=1794811 RepID=A0A0G0XIN3_9BACT|nr:MAG: ABC-3 protein [Candidatus Jorgensenbacteria bacterium GW2011_GWF2_41_8]OGN00029.1 MAG: hypothetical protein A2736_01570 [Candidatus Yanofskybacteria bacterium RIFCSPHIGHO2_01_FULL_41_27]OGN21332.1 MAG: hypothetical protein A3B00_02190 [Candidatus Yanofskybacteria bacterium RIFCSPLOWO2_01_FULL_41_33]
MINSLYLQLIVGTLIGLGSGYIGSFMVLRRMSLVGDALSHVALPGIAVALLIGINPFIGAFAALVVAILGIWMLEKKTELPSETLVGIFFTLSLAAGLLLTPKPELLEALFGDISKIGITDAIITGVFTMLIFLIITRISKGLMLSIISKDLTKSLKINVDKINLIFLFLVAVVVALGLKVAGTLLMGSLVIIPAAASKNISVSLSRYTANSAILGGLSAFAGIWVANYFNLIPGPIVVLTGGVVFLVSLLFKK